MPTETRYQPNIAASQALPAVVNLTSLDYTGASDVTAAIQAVQDSYGSNPYLLVLGAGTLTIGTSSDLRTFIRGQGIVGPGSGLLTIQYKGAGSAVKVRDSSFSSSASLGGMFGGYFINGANASAGAIGFDWGDMLKPRVDDVQVSNFNKTGSIGFNFKNTTAGSTWSEDGVFRRCRVVNCTNQVVFDTSSFDYSIFEFVLNLSANQNGIVFQNGANLVHCTMDVKGNVTAAASNTGIVWSMDKTGTGSSSFLESALTLHVECNGSTGVGPQTIFQASTSTFNAAGVMVFQDLTTAFQAATINTNTGAFAFNGRLRETSLAYGNSSGGDAQFVYGGTQWNENTNVSSPWGGPIYVDRGKFQYHLLASGATTVTFNNVGTHAVRELDMLIQQPASGSAGTITWPANVKWAGGAHTLSTANGAVDRVHLRYSPLLANWYGEITTGYA